MIPNLLPADLLPGLVHEDQLTLIAKRKGVGTTTLATELAYAFATGGRVLGHLVARRQVLLIVSHLDWKTAYSRVMMIDAIREKGIKVSPQYPNRPDLKITMIEAESEGDLPKDPSAAALHEFETALEIAKQQNQVDRPLVIIDSLDCLFRDSTLVTFKVTARVVRWLAGQGLPIVAFIDTCMARDDSDAAHITNAVSTMACLSEGLLSVTHSKVCAPTFHAPFRIIPMESDEGVTFPMLHYRGSKVLDIPRHGNPVAQGFLEGFTQDPVRLSLERREADALVDADAGPISEIVDLVRKANSEPAGNEAEQKLDALRAKHNLH